MMTDIITDNDYINYGSLSISIFCFNFSEIEFAICYNLVLKNKYMLQFFKVNFLHPVRESSLPGALLLPF